MIVALLRGGNKECKMKLRVLTIFLSLFISMKAYTERTPDECFKLRRYGISGMAQGWAISKFKYELDSCKSKSLYIPDEIGGKKVLLIDPDAFKGLGLEFVEVGKNILTGEIGFSISQAWTAVGLQRVPHDEAALRAVAEHAGDAQHERQPPVLALP